MALGKHYARLYRLQFREHDDGKKARAVPAE
jgi:hypothetical protein